MAQRRDPYVANRFVLEIEGISEGSFAEVSGLGVETEVEERHEGGVNDYVHRLPKGSKYGNLVLKRGLTDSDVLWRWHQDTVTGNVVKKSLSIVLRDALGEERWRWNVSGAFPVKWTGPELKADASTVALESLELVHHGIEKG